MHEHLSVLYRVDKFQKHWNGSCLQKLGQAQARIICQESSQRLITRLDFMLQVLFILHVFLHLAEPSVVFEYALLGRGRKVPRRALGVRRCDMRRHGMFLGQVTMVVAVDELRHGKRSFASRLQWLSGRKRQLWRGGTHVHIARELVIIIEYRKQMTVRNTRRVIVPIEVIRRVVFRRLVRRERRRACQLANARVGQLQQVLLAGVGRRRRNRQQALWAARARTMSI